MLLLAKLPSLIEELLVGAYGAGGTARTTFQLRVAQRLTSGAARGEAGVTARLGRDGAHGRRRWTR